MTNLVEDIERSLKRIFPMTDKLWTTDLALATVGSVVGSSFSFSSQWGKIPLSIFALYIAPSRKGCKSLPVNNVVIPIIKSVEERADVRFNKDLEEGKEKKWSRSILLPQTYTTEAFMSFGSAKEIDGLVFIDEFTKLLSEVSGKGYMKGVHEQMSKTWDSKDLTRFTIAHKLQEVKDPHLCVLATAALSILDVLEKNWFLQGIGNRFLYVFNPRPEFVLVTTDEFFDTTLLKESSFHSELLEGILAFGLENPNTILEASEGAKVLFTDYRNTCEKESDRMLNEDLRDRKYAYLANLSFQALRIAGILCVGDLDFSDPTFIVTETHAERAIKICREHWTQFLELHTEIDKATKPQRDEDDNKSWNRFITILKANGGEMSTTDLRKALKMSGSRYRDLITVMTRAKVLTAEKRGKYNIIILKS